MPLLGVIALVYGGFFAILASHISDASATLRDFQAQAKQESFSVIAEALDDYEREFNALPASLDVLQATPGYEHIVDYRDFDIEYVVARNLAGDYWTFDRAALYRQQGFDEVDAATYLSGPENACGATVFTNPATWCGRTSSTWYRVETRSNSAGRLAFARQYLTRGLVKFSDYINAYGKFPVEQAAGPDLTPGDVESLADIVGFAGDASNCTGTFPFEEIELSCEDLFSPESGAPVFYEYVGPRHMILLVDTTVRNSAGNFVSAAQEIEA